MDIAEELSRTQSHYGLAEHRLKDAHAENKKLRDALEDLRHQLVTGKLTRVLDSHSFLCDFIQKRAQGLYVSVLCWCTGGFPAS